MDFKYKKWLWLAAIVLVVAIADQVTKKAAMEMLTEPVSGLFPPPCSPEDSVSKRQIRRPVKQVSIIDGYFDLTYTENCGGAFSILKNQKQSLRLPFFVLSYTLAGILLFYMFYKVKRHEKVLMVALAAILGGAVGNLSDRLTTGYVVDFIYWHIKDRAGWPIFNIADVGVTLGLFLILYNTFFLAPKKEKDKRKEGDKTALAERL